MDGSSASRPGQHQDPFSAELVELMSAPMARRIRAEVELARATTISRRVQALPGEKPRGFGGVLAVYGAGYLAACAIIAVGGVRTPWLDALIIGLGVLFAAGLLILRQHRA